LFDVPPPLPPSPPPLVVTRGQPAKLYVVEMVPGAARCGTELVRPERLEAVFPVEQPSYDGAVPRLRPVAIDFEIDANGRPVSIKRSADGAAISIPGASPDVEPALARSAFPKGRKLNCRLTFNPEATPLEAASADQLIRLGLFPGQSGPIRERIGKQLSPPGSNCISSAPQPRVLVYPEIEPIARTLNSVTYSSFLYDIDAAGRPVNLRPLAGSGHAAFDAEVRRAITESRFKAEPKTGCIAPFYAQPRDELEAPLGPPLSALRPKGAPECKNALSEIPEVSFPQPFQRRGIEGWAVIRYSVAPWGEVGAIEVVEAQPAYAFGESARSLISRAKATPGAAYAGCLQRVVFKLPDKGEVPGVSVRANED
jgi:TonB family protein